MSDFDPKFIDEVRRTLEAEKATVGTRLNALLEQDPFADPERLMDNAASDAEAFEESNHDRVSAQADELKVQLVAIDDALFRVGNGTYGTCKNCGNIIDASRLKILPTATLCLNCEAKKLKH